MKLHFFGAARNVTGSCYLLEAEGKRCLVDCGMYQERDLRDRNWAPFPFAPDSIDAVLLTHAHLDHCGLLPKLVRDGFRGRIYCTPATADITRIVLADAARIQVEDAEFKKRRHEREGRKGPHPEVPLYTSEDAEAVFPLFEATPYEQPATLAPGLQAEFHDAGHILGSAMIRVQAGTNDDRRTLVFSGDVGRWNTPILRDPTVFEQADYVVTESTYGERDHDSEEQIPGRLAELINRTRQAGGNIIIPSFAVERTQELLYHLHRLLREDRIPHLVAFLDSPMAIRVTEVFRRHTDLFDEESAALLKRGEHPCDLPGLVLSRTVDESKAINHIQGSVLIIAGSGMCTGGRIKHHLVNNIGDERNTILFVGYQARNTLGRVIVGGAKNVRILGEEHEVKADVRKIGGFSGHADRRELLRWLKGLKNAPRQVFVTHGEDKAVEGFANLVRKETGWPVRIADYELGVDLD